MQHQLTKHDWTTTEITELFDLPFNELLYQAATVHRRHFASDTMQISGLLSIKTGECPEDCAYCAQSSHHQGKIKAHELLSLSMVIEKAQAIKRSGGTRFCMGAAWRAPDQEEELEQVLTMVREVKKLGLETCVNLGMLTLSQAQQLKDAGLDYYNHNLDTSPRYYQQIISTRVYSDRLETLNNLRQVGIKVCCGGIVGMGETKEDRIELLRQLSSFPEHPNSVPINYFMPMPGTPLARVKPLDPFELVKVIAVARILMPRSTVRLAAGRERMSDELQAWCFFAGANSIFGGDKLLTANNPELSKDYNLLARLGIKPHA